MSVASKVRCDWTTKRGALTDFATTDLPPRLSVMTTNNNSQQNAAPGSQQSSVSTSASALRRSGAVRRAGVVVTDIAATFATSTQPSATFRGRGLFDNFPHDGGVLTARQGQASQGAASQASQGTTRSAVGASASQSSRPPVCEHHCLVVTLIPGASSSHHLFPLAQARMLDPPQALWA